MNITQGFCREVAKRARKGRVAGISFAIVAALAVTLYAQSRGTPSTLRIKIDSTGALAVSSAAITNPTTTVVFNNARLAVDSNGYLVVTDGSGAGFAPANATYIVKTANASLTNAQSLGVLNSGLLLNTKVGTTGTLSQYAGATCTNQFIKVLSSLGVATCASVSLTADISGVLPVANGGTNISSYTTGDILYASASGVLSKLADVAIGSVLVSGGVGAAPSYSASPTVTGRICGTNNVASSCDPAGWGTRNHLTIIDDTSAGNGQPIFELVNNATDAASIPLGVIDAVFPSQNGGQGNELAQIYFYSDGSTATKRGGQMSFYAKGDNTSTLYENMRLEKTGSIYNATSCATNNVGFIGFLNGPRFWCKTTTQLQFYDSGNSGSVVFDIGSNGVLNIYQSNGSTEGTVKTGTFNANAKSTYGATADKLTQINDNANATGMEINVGTPTLGTCTGGTMVSGSHNFGGEVTGNTSGSCVINFGTPNFTNTPFCMINDEGSLTAARVSARSASSITVTGVPSGEAFQFMCFGRIGT